MFTIFSAVLAVTCRAAHASKNATMPFFSKHLLVWYLQLQSTFGCFRFPRQQVYDWLKLAWTRAWCYIYGEWLPTQNIRPGNSHFSKTRKLSCTLFLKKIARSKDKNSQQRMLMKQFANSFNMLHRQLICIVKSLAILYASLLYIAVFRTSFLN